MTDRDKEMWVISMLVLVLVIVFFIGFAAGKAHVRTQACAVDVVNGAAYYNHCVWVKK